MEAKAYLSALRRFWWLILAGPILAGATAFLYSQSLTPIYRTGATLLVNQTQVSGSLQYNDILTSERLTNTYAELLDEQQAYRQPVIEELGLGLTLDELSDKVSIDTVPDTQLLRVTVEDPSPQLAADIANALAVSFIDENATQLSNQDNLSVAVGARVPTAPASPNVMQNTVLSVILGLMIAGGVAVLLEYLDDTLKRDDATEELFGLPTLGSVRRLKPRLDVTSLQDNPAAADLFTQLRTNVHFAGLGKQLRTLVVTGSTPGEGKSTTAAGLAIALAQADRRVILVDTDLRRPSLHKMFRVSNSYGITGMLLSQSEDLKSALVQTRYENLLLLPSGPVPANPADLLMSASWQKLMDRLAEVAHYVVFDTPPVLGASDASILAGRADGTILVAEAGTARRNAIHEALETLAQTNATLIGIVKNKVRTSKHSYYYQYRSEPEEAVTGQTRHNSSSSGSSIPADPLQASGDRAQKQPGSSEEEPAA